jgi:lactoylglutathione lyase
MAEPISVRGLFEAHLTVSDMDRAVAFYRDVVGLVVAHEVPERGATFFWVGSPGDGMLGLWSLGSAPVTLALHVAFTVAMPDVLGACGHLRARGVTPLSFFGSETEEPSVIGWMPAAAVYFRDPDGHQLEYLAMLDAAPRPELGIVPWSQWPAGGPGVDIRWHAEGRTELRPLFELAEDSSERLDHYIDLGRVLVAYDERSIAGHLQLVQGRGPGELELQSMAVDERRRRRGIGRALVQRAIDVARAEGVRRLLVATATADTGNLRFYQRMGFRMLGVEPDAFTTAQGYPDGVVIDGIPLRDRVWLSLSLDGS